MAALLESCIHHDELHAPVSTLKEYYCTDICYGVPVEGVVEQRTSLFLTQLKGRNELCWGSHVEGIGQGLKAARSSHPNLQLSVKL